ncbi:zinc finger protein 511 lethal (2) k10201 isoform X4 [Amblyomma americanum]
MNVSTSEPLSVDQVRILLAEGVDLCARYASSKLTVLDDDCDPDALQRRYGGTLQCSCPRVFDSVRDFEGHYANRHRLACVQCHTSLPTVHLLELHIAESHDPLFAAADRLKYQCVVEGCVERFASVSDRKQHAVEVHRSVSAFIGTQLALPTSHHCLRRRSRKQDLCFVAVCREVSALAVALVLHGTSRGHHLRLTKDRRTST